MKSIQKELSTKRAEIDRLSAKLDKALVLTELFEKFGAEPEWPVHLQFSGNARNKDVYCAFRNSHSTFLRLHYADVPEILYPEQLKKDLKL